MNFIEHIKSNAGYPVDLVEGIEILQKYDNVTFSTSTSGFELFIIEACVARQSLHVEDIEDLVDRGWERSTTFALDERNFYQTWRYKLPVQRINILNGLD